MISKVGLVALVATAALGPSCKTKEISFALDVPSAIGQSVAWFEIGAYANAACPSDAQLQDGVPLDGMATYVAFAASDASPPAVGSLPRGHYAFAAVARQSDCGVIATGCATVDVSQSSTVTIELAPTPAPLGACESGTICDDARCISGGDTGDPSIGAGCSLQLTGAGPLGDPLSMSSTLLSAPVIVATGTGFLIAYRELDPSTASARLTLIPVDEGGGSGSLTTDTSIAGCNAAADADSTGFAFGSASGVVALARPSCQGGPSMVGVDLFQVDPSGNVMQSGFKAVAGQRVSLATAKALTATPDGYLLAMTIDGQTYQAPVAGVDLAAAPAAFGGSPPQSAAWVAATDQGTALLALGSGGPAVDGGPQPEGGTAGDAGVGGATLRLSTAAQGTDLAMLPPPTELVGRWGSVSMAGTRAIVVSNGTTSGQPVVWHAFDIGNPMAVAQGGFSLSVLGEAVYADVAVQGDHAFIAVEVSGMAGTISLVALDHVSTTPAYLRETPFAGESRIPIGNLRDGLVSVAATDSRVAVVWGTGKTLGFNDGVGGYAVFACTP